MLLREASFVVVDTETTGGNAASDRMIEIGAVRIEGGRVADRFEHLVNPECAVPRRITRLTGISNAMVFDAPPACDVLPRFLDFLGGDVLVAHNLTFDARVLNAECRRIGRIEIPNESVCTLRLARRLLPGLRSKGLASLVDFYGIRSPRRHRALADAEATAEVLLRFLEQVELEFGLERLAELLALQYRRYSDLQKESRHVTRLRQEVLGRIPEVPGVYFMKDGRGRTMYVGKAQNLQTRVRSYFTSIEGHPPRIRQMIRNVRDVAWQETESELEALMLESRLIKEMKPAYNRAQLRYVNRPFIRIASDQPYPRVTMSAFVHDDGAEYYGPMASKSEAEFVVDLIDRMFQLRECDDEELAKGRRCVYASMGRCLAPCDGAAPEYGAELDRVRAFLLGRNASVLERVEAAMREAAATMDYEQAAVYRDWIRRLDGMFGKREAVASRVLDHNAIVVHRPASRSPRLLLIRRGRHVETLSASDVANLEDRLEVLFAADAEDPEVYRQREVDELHLLSHWLYVHRADVRQLHWQADDTPGTMAARVRAELGRARAVQPAA